MVRLRYEGAADSGRERTSTRCRCRHRGEDMAPAFGLVVGVSAWFGQSHQDHGERQRQLLDDGRVVVLGDVSHGVPEGYEAKICLEESLPGNSRKEETPKNENGQPSSRALSVRTAYFRFHLDAIPPDPANPEPSSSSVDWPAPFKTRACIGRIPLGRKEIRDDNS